MFPTGSNILRVRARVHAVCTLVVDKHGNLEAWPCVVQRPDCIVLVHFCRNDDLAQKALIGTEGIDKCR